MRNRIFRQKPGEQQPAPPPPKKKARPIRRRFRFNRAERIALLANGIIWTLVVWAALIFALLQDGQMVWQWLRIGPISAQIVPPAHPQPNLTDWQAPGPTATIFPSPTATPVIIEPTTGSSKPPTSEATEPPPPPSPTATPVIIEPTTVPPTPPPPEPPPAPTASAAPASAQAEEAAIVLPQPVDNAAPLPVVEPALPARPTRLLIPSIGLEASIVPVGWELAEEAGHLLNVWQVADDAVGWHQNSALPGQPGNVVLSGHSNIGGEVFRHLPEVSEGDLIVVMVGNRPVEYRISLTTIVKEAGEPLATRVQNARWIAPTADARLTLVTCWPYPYSTHRFIAVANPV